MNDANLPQCLPTVRLQEMLLDGTLGEQEVQALESDLRVGGQYRRLRACDGRFKAMLALGQPSDNQNEGADAAEAPQKPPQLLYAEYLYCASGALCEKPLIEWATCVKSLQTQKTDIGDCAQAKRLLERCLRGKTEDLLRAAKPQVFRPNGIS